MSGNFWGERLAATGMRYRRDDAVTAFRSGVQSPDPTNLSSIGSVPAFTTDLCRNVALHGRYSTPTGATSVTVVRGVVTVLQTIPSLVTSWCVLGKETYSLPLEADATINQAGKYLSDEIYFDVGGAESIKVIVGAVIGSVDLHMRRF